MQGVNLVPINWKNKKIQNVTQKFIKYCTSLIHYWNGVNRY